MFCDCLNLVCKIQCGSCGHQIKLQFSCQLHKFKDFFIPMPYGRLKMLK
jgi:hypothetical protein